MTRRDPVAEWMHALAKRESFAMDAHAGRGATAPMQITGAMLDRGATKVGPTREMTADNVRRRMNWRADLGDAIRMMQRHNKRLLSAFGINWVDATRMVIGEAQRRALPASTMARAIAAGLPQAKGEAR